MVVPYSWLKDYVDIDVDEQTFCERMTNIGMMVEGVERVGAELSNVVVGKVVSLSKHPNADKLFITRVDVGGGEPLQIVTGATNLFEGAVVPVALNGAMLANGVRIKSGKLRGELSDGMLCSIEELGQSRDAFPEAAEDGIYVFPNNVELTFGSDAVDALKIRETLIDFDLTSNRPDCYSVAGLAREASAALDKPFVDSGRFAADEGAEKTSDYIKVEIEDAALCPRYCALAVKDVKIEPSPSWLRRRLAACGVRPINNIVDITNYVMLELGQPLHAFDLDSVKGGKIVVRRARENEQTFVTLDGVERRLTTSTLVICDAEEPVAVAGIMGGEFSKVTDGKTILFESANFDRMSVRLSGKRLGLRTESSGRFERGLPASLAEEAVKRVGQLVRELGAGTVLRWDVDVYPNKKETKTIHYDPQRVAALLGADIGADEIRGYLGRLGFEFVGENAVMPPYWRGDVAQEADIAEEVARLFGYNNILGRPLTGGELPSNVGNNAGFVSKLKGIMTGLGFDEALTFAFESPKALNRLRIPEGDALRDCIIIQNPLGDDYSVMRTTTANAMLTALSTNIARRNESVRLFEVAKTYIAKSLPLTEPPCENVVLTIGAYGSGSDFFDVKGTVENLFEILNIDNVEYRATGDIPLTHPGRTAALSIDGERIGFFGEIHPRVAENYELGTNKCLLAVIDVAELMSRANDMRKFVPLPRFPRVKRDAAFLVDDHVAAADLEAALLGGKNALFRGLRLFDAYKGKGIPDGKKSLAYSLVFGADDRTLVDAEIQGAFDKMVEAAKRLTGAELRAQ